MMSELVFLRWPTDSLPEKEHRETQNGYKQGIHPNVEHSSLPVAGLNKYSRRLDPFYFIERRAEVPDSCVRWETNYVNQRVYSEENEAWDINQRYSDVTNIKTEGRNPKGRTGLHHYRYLPSQGANTLIHFVITREVKPEKNPNISLEVYQEVLVCQKKQPSDAPHNDWASPPPGLWSLPVTVLRDNAANRLNLSLNDLQVVRGLPRDFVEKLYAKLGFNMLENEPDTSRRAAHDLYLDDPRNTDFAWLETSVIKWDVDKGELDVNVDSEGNLVYTDKDSTKEQSVSGDYSFCWINFDENVSFAHDVHSSTRIVINKCLSTRTQDKITGLVPGTLKFKGIPAACKFAITPQDCYCASICHKLLSGPRPDIGWWSRRGEKEKNADQKQFFWKPNAIISVTGGAQDFKMSDSPRDEAVLVDKIFKEGILKAAVSMKALIVDGGFSAGVMKQIGRAVAEDGNRVATLGICPWRAVLERWQIDQRAAQDSELECTYEIESGHQNTAFCARLDENHSYFVFVDSEPKDGKDAWGEEINMRFQIECELSKGDAPQLISDAPQVISDVDKLISDAPHVLVVVNGGVGSIKTVHKLSASEGKITSTTNASEDEKRKRVPIVVVEGSGKAADFIACTWRHFHGEARNRNTRNAKAIKDEIGCRLCIGPENVCTSCVCLSAYKNSEQLLECKYLKARFKEYFGTNVAVSDERDLLQRVVESCVRKEAVTIYNLESDNSLSYAIMKAVCMGTIQRNGSKYTIDQTMSLLEKWNSPEAAKVARNEILPARKKELTTELRQFRLFSSLIHNRNVFVELLLDFDVELGQKDLHALYSHETLGKFADDDDTTLERYAPNLRTLNLVQKLEKRSLTAPAPARTPSLPQSNTDTQRDAVSNYDAKKLILHFLGWEEIDVWEEETVGAAAAAANREGIVKEENVNREDLFLWAILTGRLQLAELFWRRCGPALRQHSITRALLACSLAKTIGAKLPPVARVLLAGNDTEPENHKNIADHFESIACEILDLCYTKSQNKAVSLLMMPMVHCSKKIWMDRKFRRASMNSNWGSAMFMNAIILACDAQAHTFASHNAVQSCLDEIWTGRIMIFDDDDVLISEEQRLGLSDPKGLRFRHQGILSFIPTDGFFMRWKMYKANLDVLLSALFIVPILLMDASTDAAAKSRPVEGLQQVIISWGMKISAFYSAPVTKFWLDFASYLTFLVLYTHAGLFMEYEFSLIEIVVNFWILALILRELWEYSLMGKRYYNTINNIYDVIMLVFYIPAIVLRLYERWGLDRTSYNAVGALPESDGMLVELANATLAVYQHDGEDLWKARSWHGMAGILFWIRLSDFFRVSRTLGPLTQILLKVVRDAVKFYLFLLIFIISFGSAMICAGRPRADPGVPFYALAEQAVYLPYMAIFGEHYMSGVTVSFNNNPACDLDRDATCSNRPKLGIILYALYLFISSVILLNLLIAMMSESYQSVLNSSTRAWKFQRMEIVLQYCSSSAWPHPLSVVAEPIVSCFLHAMGGEWIARSGSLDKMRNDVPKKSREVFCKGGKLAWEAFYKDDSCMAAMHQEVFHEALPVLARREYENPDRLSQQAEYMRRCADLVVRMTAKRNALSPRA